MTTNISAYNLSERQTQLDLSVLPYDFEDNVKVLSEQARQTWNDVQDLEASACPDNKAQITITMHPSFASQIYFPEEFLLVMGLECVGVRQVQCFPRDTSSCDTEDGEITVALVCVGKRQDIQAIPGKLEKVVSDTLVGKQIRTIESIEAVSIYDRLDIPNDYFDDHFLVGVYQTPGKTVEESKEDFKNYAQKNDLEVHPNFLVDKEGVFYVLLRGARYKLDAIGDYAYTFCVRVPALKKA